MEICIGVCIIMGLYMMHDICYVLHVYVCMYIYIYIIYIYIYNILLYIYMCVTRNISRNT